MLLIILLVLLGALLFLPNWWAKRVLAHYDQDTQHFPGTGGELAKHLIQALHLPDIQVEQTEQGDHYDPIAKTVRLSPDVFQHKSLTAIVVSAHEIGHALQDHLGYRPLQARLQLLQISQRAEKLGAILMFAIPILALITRTPVVGFLTLLAALCTLGIPSLVHFITLPVEWDASFQRALPILREGGYLSAQDEPAARRILTACALTYVAAALANLLNIARWIALLRR